MSTPTGDERFDAFRDMIREGTDVRMVCEAQVDNLELWSAHGPNGRTRFVVIIGDDGFSVFHESPAMMEANVAEILDRIA